MLPTFAADSEVSIVDELRSDPGKRPMMFFDIDPLRDPRWRVFVEHHPDFSVFHRVEWLQALQSCYCYVPVAKTAFYFAR